MAKAGSIKPKTPQRPIDRLISPLQWFLRIQAAGGILLIICAAVALIWANSPWWESYHDFWHTKISFGIGSYFKEMTLHHWINDGLMAVFFFVIGLEVKRELLVGELANPRKAAIPIAAAVGGMVVPVLVFAAINWGHVTESGGQTMRGWAIPCATDIAFALGVLGLLGSRVPVSLKVFVTAAAIIDDIGAILIIAIFYSGDLSMEAHAAAGAITVVLIVANRLHIRQPVVYATLGLLLWFAVLESGIHATIAGVVLAFTIPSQYRIQGKEFVEFTHQALDEFARNGGDQNDILTNRTRQDIVLGMESACEYIQTPLSRLEHMVHPWSSFVIMPIFALANAGVHLSGGLDDVLSSRLALGVVLGLIIGKQIGIFGFAWLAVKLNLGQLGNGLRWPHVYACGWLAGIGFTMSLFIAELGFGRSDPLMLEQAKMGILCGSVIAGLGALAVTHWVTRKR